MKEGTKDAANPAITQKDLEGYKAIQEQLGKLKRQVAQERDRLVRLVECHAPVEPGRLGVEVRELAQQLVTKAFLISVLGETGYEEMRAEAPPTVYRRLVVKARVRGRGPSPMEQVRSRTWPSLVRWDRP